MVEIHQSFLRAYGRSAKQTPLLRYLCSQYDEVVWDQAERRNKPALPPGQCFEDVSVWSSVR